MFVTYTLNQMSVVMQLTTEFEYAIIAFLSEPHLCFNAFVTAVLMSLINHYKRPDNPLHNGVGSYKEKQVGRQTSRIDSTVQGCAVRLGIASPLQ